MSTFKEIGIGNLFTEHLRLRGIKIATEVQEHTIEIIKNGKDVVAEAPTGTGKTLAFLLPIFENIIPESKFTQGLIITPTRELAIQIKAEAEKLATVKKINILLINLHIFFFMNFFDIIWIIYCIGFFIRYFVLINHFFC